MSFPKIKASHAADAINDPLDTYITQAIGKEPLLSFTKANDAPVQLFQLLQSLDQGWPLISPLKVQLQKCDKCSREFCSTINYRRHMRLHRRNLNLDKDSTKRNRSLLQAFWDKLSVEEATEIMSFKDVSLEGVPGSSIVKALTLFVRKPGFTPLPQGYLKAGYSLLDIVQARPSSFPISSQELFSVFDEASEDTFLCAGAAESLQKYVFDGEAGKIGLEMRNVVACTSFLAEKKLVKACLADKDAEALRYQKLLMEEEEAAQNRQAALLEKKRQKKLRQKEPRIKEVPSLETDEESSPSPRTSSSPDASDINPEMPETIHDRTSSPEPLNLYEEINSFEDRETYQHLAHVEHRSFHQSGRRSRWQAQKLHRTPNGFHPNHNYKSGPTQKLVSYRDFRTPNGGKVWTPKPKSQTDEESHKTRRVQIEANLQDVDKKHQLFIGSISVALGFPIPSEKKKPDKVEVVVEAIANHSNGGELSVRNCSSDASEVGVVPCYNDYEVQTVVTAQNNSNTCQENLNSSRYQGGLKFSSDEAEAFLTKRWKEAIASNHLELVLLPEPQGQPPGIRCPRDSVNSVKLKISKVKYIPKQRNT